MSELPVEIAREFPFLPAFISSVDDVIRANTAQDIVFQRAVKNEAAPLLGDVLALMTFGGAVRGHIALGSKREQAAGLLAAFLGIRPEEVSVARMCDGVVELLSMVAGNAKARLAGTPWHFEVTLPFAVSGSDCVFARKSGAPRLTLYFETMRQPLVLDMAVQPAA